MHSAHDGAFAYTVADGTIEISLTCEYVQEVLLVVFSLSGATPMFPGESQTLYVFIFLQFGSVHAVHV